MINSILCIFGLLEQNRRDLGKDFIISNLFVCHSDLDCQEMVRFCNAGWVSGILHVKLIIMFYFIG